MGLCVYVSLKRVSRVRETKEEEMDKMFWGDSDSLILSPLLSEAPENKI